MAVFTGRRQLGGVEHNRAIVLEGVAHEEHGKPVLLNPAYTLLPTATADAGTAGRAVTRRRAPSRARRPRSRR